VKDSGFVFGGYIHCAWPAVNRTVADPSGMSFLFSLVNATNKAARFSLQDKDRAIELTVSSVRFGAIKMEGGQKTGWSNFAILICAITTNVANEAHGAAFQPDDG
jgi:hypothetical protein